jgi:hypothetical protein
VGPRLDLPCEPDRQLVPLPPDGHLRPRGAPRGHGRHPHLRPLSVRRRRGRRNHVAVRPATILGASPSPCTPTTSATARRRPRGDRPVRRAARPVVADERVDPRSARRGVTPGHDRWTRDRTRPRLPEPW